jgi:hypothetical protein
MTGMKLNTTFLLAGGILLASQAQAHVRTGFYDGMAMGSVPCSIEVKQVHFVGVRSPLNERVEIVYENREFTLSHSPRVDLNRNALTFEAGKLSSVRGLEGGAEGFVLSMVHTPEHTGPVAFTYIRKSGIGNEEITTVSTCEGLHFRE